MNRLELVGWEVVAGRHLNLNPAATRLLLAMCLKAPEPIALVSVVANYRVGHRYICRLRANMADVGRPMATAL